MGTMATFLPKNRTTPHEAPQESQRESALADNFFFSLRYVVDLFLCVFNNKKDTVQCYSHVVTAEFGVVYPAV